MSAGLTAVSPSQSPSKALDTPARKKKHRETEVRNVAKQQVAGTQRRLDKEAPSSSAPAAAVLKRQAVDGFIIVYPGKDGEEVWTTWKGR